MMLYFLIGFLQFVVYNMQPNKIKATFGFYVINMKRNSVED